MWRKRTPMEDMAEVPRSPPETCNVYTSGLNIDHRMNNTVDSWQSKFQELMAVHHSSI